MELNYTQMDDRMGNLDPLVRYINLYLKEKDCEKREKLANFLKEKNREIFYYIKDYPSYAILVNGKYYHYNRWRNEYQRWEDE